MRKLIILLVLIAFVFTGLLFGHSLIGQKGYVLVSFGHTIIEMSVISALITLLLILLGVRILEWLFKLCLSAVLGSKRWFGVLSARRQKRALYDAINHFATGQLALAKKAVEKTFGGEFAGSNYIIAADIDKRLNNGANVIRLLETAQTYKESETAAKIQLADWYISQANYKSALLVLDTVPANTAKTKQLGILWLNCLAGLGQWIRFKEVLSHYKKTMGTDYLTWAQQATKSEFAEVASKQGAHALKEKWENLSRTARKDIANQLVYVELLIAQGMSQEAEKLISEFCVNKPNPAFFKLIKKLAHPNPTSALSMVEKWIKKDLENATLYSVLAHLAANSGNNELAEKAICKALDLGKDTQDALLYAHLLEARKDYQQAALVYKQAI